MEIGKREQPSLIAAVNDGFQTRRIFITDQTSKVAFLIDTGADVCVYPRERVSGYVHNFVYEHFAANCTAIATYGTIAADLDFSLRRSFKWRVIVAEDDSPIDGIEFLAFYGLLVDAKNKLLIDSTTGLKTNGQAASGSYNTYPS